VCNGLEASPEGAAVRVWVEREDDGGVRFRIQNPGVMPGDVQARVFQRSFSTKASAGRGLGTYSMKLFGERVLGGKVGFVSSADVGTLFTVSLPVAPRGG
jgi:signal transduction histidine kinase